ncbi:MAG: hypothetical protein ABFS86_09540 [Planctomycetota bacterium]
MPVNNYAAEMMSDHQEERISALERQAEELLETIETLRDTIRVEDGELILQSESIRIEADNDLAIRAGNSCTVTALATVRIDSSGRLQLNSASMDTSTGVQTVNSAMSTFSGMIRCQTIQADTVIGSSYTPGAGNVM